MFLMLDIKLII